MFTFNNDEEKLSFLRKYELATSTEDTIPTLYYYSSSFSEVPSLCEVIGYEHIYEDWAIITIKANEEIINIHSSYLLEMKKNGKKYMKNNTKI